MKIAASYLGIKDNFKENLHKLASANIDYIHVDVMDGNFVLAKTPNVIDELMKLNVKKDVHLMVENIKEYVDLYSELNPSFITFHIETNNNVNEIIEYIKNKNIGVGISLNPDTNINVIKEYLDLVDLVLVMSVNPGLPGQSFIDVKEKIDYLNSVKSKYNFIVEVDGGINDSNIKQLDVDIAVVGSFITNGDYQLQVNKLKEI